MTPEQLKQFEEMQSNQIKIMEFLNKLMSTETIPIEVQSAFTTRLGGLRLAVSAKSASSENQAVNEGGSATYSVLKPPTGFRSMTIEGGTTINIPYY